jgi:hypothetical protein
MITCPWCGTHYAKFQPNCKNCGGSLPHPPSPEAGALPAPPPPPRQVPRGYARRILFTQGGGIVGLVFAILGAVFFPLGVGLSLAVVTLFVGLPFLILGLAFLGVGLGLLAWRYRRAQATVEVLRDGHAVLGEIAQVYENLHVQVNGRFPWTIGYRFEVHGHGYAGRVTTLSRPGLGEQPGKPVYVLYAAGDPEQNTIYPNPYGYYGF